MTNYTNSPLVEYTHISPYRNSPRNQPITKITWHHTAGVCSLEQFDAIVHRAGRNMSSNYMVDKDARVGLFCPESDRCWCSSSAWNDNRAVVLEISNSKAGGDWPISDKVYKKCIELTVDICKRNGIKKLTYTGDKNGSLTFHRFYAATGCVPIETTEVLTPTGWVRLADIKIGDRIAAANPKTCEIKFERVENLVPVRNDAVYTVYGMTVTNDHRVLCHQEDSNKIGYDFVQFSDLTAKNYTVPAAGNMYHAPGMCMTSSEMVFLLEYQKLGMLNDDGTIEFSYIMEQNAAYMYTLLNNTKMNFKRVQEDLGPVKFIVDDPRAKELIDTYMNGKDFNHMWMTMSPTQFSYFIYKITSHEDGSWRRKYTSDSLVNIDIVQALCAVNERGSHYRKSEKTLYVGEPYRSITTTHAQRVDDGIDVSCVTVKSGAFLIRQNGYTTITGNCPGPYIFSRAQQICDDVNAQLEEKPTPEPTVEIKVGDLVKIAEGAVWYGTTKAVPSWVIADKWYVSSISGTRAVLGKNESKTSDINSAIDTKYLTVVTPANTTKPEPVVTPPAETFKSYTKTLNKGTIVYSITNGTVRSSSAIKTTGVYTICEETIIGTIKYGKLKSGIGWIKVGSTASSSIKVGDYVKVLNAVTYEGKSFKVYNSKYKVLQVNGSRIVISADGKNVTAAVNAKNLQKI